MAKLVQVIEDDNDEVFYISLNDKQYEFFQWLKKHNYLNDDITFREKDKVDDIIDLS